MKRALFIIFYCTLFWVVKAATVLPISDIYSWSKTDLNPYIGKTVSFPVPVYVNDDGSTLTVSPRHAVTGTEVALPGSIEWANQSVTNAAGSFQLTGAGSHRLGETVENLTVKVNSSSSVSFVSGNWVANSRNQLLAGPDMSLIDKRGEHNILVCAMNLEYYLVSNWGEGYGPNNKSQHNKQRKKISQALALINADLYGLVEVQKGTAALQEIADDLKKITGRNFKLISSPSSAQGTYTQSAFVYCSDVLIPALQHVIEVGGGPSDRRLMMMFQDTLYSGETFIFSINHFKSKTGSGTGDDSDHNDGQGSHNGTRTREAQAVFSAYDSKRKMFQEDDILIMGDLNAYSMEDPIRLFVDTGMTNLHKYFYHNESYSYRYKNQVGVLDHALVNSTLLPQVTGMLAFHINSDEDDCHTYNGSCADETIFRSSDHDPILVGLRLDSTAQIITDNTYINNDGIYSTHKDIVVYNAKRDNNNAYYTIYTIAGQIYEQGELNSNEHVIRHPQYPGVYIVSIYANGQIKQFKIIVQ